VNRINKGDLVYVPSDVTLFISDRQGAVRKIMKLHEPANLLVTKIHNNTYEVFYENEEWLVKKNKTYEVRND
jgi:hypothetical protein